MASTVSTMTRPIDVVPTGGDQTSNRFTVCRHRPTSLSEDKAWCAASALVTRGCSPTIANRVRPRATLAGASADHGGPPCPATWRSDPPTDRPCSNPRPGKRAASASDVCEHCGNRYDKAFTIVMHGQSHVFDSFECAIHMLAPRCDHCQCRIIGHGVESRGTLLLLRALRRVDGRGRARRPDRPARLTARVAASCQSAPTRLSARGRCEVAQCAGYSR